MNLSCSEGPVQLSLAEHVLSLPCVASQLAILLRCSSPVPWKPSVHSMRTKLLFPAVSVLPRLPAQPRSLQETLSVSVLLQGTS